MRKFLIIFVTLIFGLALLVLHILHSGGFFRKVTEPFANGEIIQTLLIPGAEDISISRSDSFLIISSDDRGAHLNNRKRTGGIYKIDLKATPYEARLLSGLFNQPLYPHGISLIETDSGSYRLFVINHLNDSHPVEVFDLFGDSLAHVKTIHDPALVSPNDLVALDTNRFYMTNDHKNRHGWKRITEDYLGLAISDVRFYNGEIFTMVADGIAYANGINYDESNNRLFVASPRGFLVKVYEVGEDMNLTHIEDIDVETGVDNIEFDEAGKLWIGSHPNLLQFSSYMAGKNPLSPSEIITIDYRGKGDYDFQSIFLDDGSSISASTIAVPFGDEVFIGSVMDDEVIVWRK